MPSSSLGSILPFLLSAIRPGDPQGPGDAGPEPTQGFRIESRDVATPDGGRLTVELGSLAVPENRHAAKSRSIRIAFARLKSPKAGDRPPTLFLAGGPGDSATQSARDPNRLRGWLPLLEVGDVVLVDQRGAGSSEPNLTWRAPEPPPTDVFLSRDRFVRGAVEAAEKAGEHFRSNGVDLLGYTTVESADDLDALRAALGYERVRLLGFSYGTHLALATMRRHGPRILRAVLVGTAGPDDLFKLPSAYDRKLAALSELVARDPRIGARMPDFDRAFRDLVARLDREPARVELRGSGGSSTLSLPVGGFGLALLVARDLGDRSDIPVLPRLIHSVAKGDVAVLRWFVEKRYAALRELQVLAPVCRAASGATPERWKRIEAEVPSSAFGLAPNWAFLEMGRALGAPDLGDGYRAPIESEVPTMFVSGTLDSNTPPDQAEAIGARFPNAVHLVVENGGHEDLLPNPEVRRAILRFFRGEVIGPARLSQPPPRFILLEGRDSEVDHPAVR